MQTTLETIQKSRQQDYEKYHAAEFERLWQDETTWVAETLDAPLEKDRIYTYRDGEIYSLKNEPLTPIFEDGIAHYRDLAARKPKLAFQYERSLLERGELTDMFSMARGEGPNTMFIDSTYPDDLDDATEDVLGYQHKRKLGFIRIIKRLPNNQLQMWTHSYDGKDRDGIDAMHRVLGAHVDWSKDVLGQRVRLDLDPEEMELIGDRLLYAYDAVLNQKYGGLYYAGRSEEDRRDAIQFVESQPDLVAHHVREVLKHGKKPGFLSDQRYDFAIAMRRRHEGRQVVADSIAAEMGGAGDMGRAAGETASGCGITEGGQAQSATDDLAESGYKVVDYKNEMHEGEKIHDDCMKCPLCKKVGVLIEKINGKIYYTCESSSGCKTTTKTTDIVDKQQAEQQTQSEPTENETPEKELPPLVSTEDLLRQMFGKDIRIDSEVGMGTRYYIAYDVSSGIELGRI